MSARATATAAWASSLNYADNTIAGATTGNTDARRLYASAGLGQIDSQVQDRKSNYNSMQFALVKRYSNGFTITSNYTLSKVEGDFGGEVIPYTMPQDQALLWGPLDQDHRHRFTTSWVWDLPGGNMEGPMKWVIGGWQWTGVMQYQTGRPFTVTSGQDNSLDGIGNDRAKITGQPYRGLRRVRRRPCGSTRRRSRRTISVRSAKPAAARTTGRRCRPGIWDCSRISAWPRT